MQLLNITQYLNVLLQCNKDTNKHKNLLSFNTVKPDIWKNSPEKKRAEKQTTYEKCI